MEHNQYSFRIKSYGFQELAILYAPGLQPESASKRLKSWLLANKELTSELYRWGWTRRSRILTPVQVSIIVRYLGEP
ncbi:MAG: DUF4248 domain-containing protein [Tannerellaceae bacterium]|nr:DUF4248 domain-containing protein [Tannerellaceae bacterium]